MSEPLWIHKWQDGPWEVGCLFSEKLADRDEVTDDHEAWERYEEALSAVAFARAHLESTLRTPTAEEREAYRQEVRAHLATLDEVGGPAAWEEG